MRISLIRFLFLTTIVAAACGIAAAQGADGGPLFGRGEDRNEPMGFRDMVKKLQIEKEKKEFEEMQDRGKQALEISNELEKSVADKGQFTDADKAKLETLEKLVKRIRRDLGGSDDDKTTDDDGDETEKTPASVVEGFKTLQDSTFKLVDELQKNSRFTVSTAAIRSTNAVLRLVRSLRFWK